MKYLGHFTINLKKLTDRSKKNPIKKELQDLTCFRMVGYDSGQFETFSLNNQDPPGNSEYD